MAEPAVLLLLPRALERFILRDQAEDLLRSPGVVAIEPGRMPYGALGRLPEALADALAAARARRLRLARGRAPRAVVIYHPFQYPLARALIARHPGCELWYSRWDRYERAGDAGARTRARLERLHEQAAARSSLTFAVSHRLVELEHEAGRRASLVPLAADSFPAPDPGDPVIAFSLGHLGRRVDWSLLRAVAERMPELVVLLIGAVHEDESGEEEDFRACRSLPNLVWVGAQPDEQAARLILCADVGILPFRVEPFNDAALPYRILKGARLGRRTVTPPLSGVRTWKEAVVVADGAEAWVQALRGHEGARGRPDGTLRAWALRQTAASQNAPLWERMKQLGVAAAPSASA